MEAHDATDAQLASLEREAGVPGDLTSCHIARIGGYVIEGHVPAADIKRLLKERPAIAGLVVPGMPSGSPGMEQGGAKDHYNVIALAKDGRRSIFAKY